jgi:hypothetical protein
VKARQTPRLPIQTRPVGPTDLVDDGTAAEYATIGESVAYKIDALFLVGSKRDRHPTGTDSCHLAVTLRQLAVDARLLRRQVYQRADRRNSRCDGPQLPACRSWGS